MIPTKEASNAVRLLRLGEIKLGTKETHDDGIFFTPADHFICPDEVIKVFGEKPKNLRIMFPTEDANRWVRQYYKLYSRFGNLLCRGNGETALSITETTDQQPGSGEGIASRMLEEPCTPDSCPGYLQGYCHQVMSLQFLLPDCSESGVYQINTRSILSMNNINNFLRRMRGTGKLISLVPLSLELKEQRMPGSLKPAYVLHIVWPDSTVKNKQSTWLQPGMSLILPPPGCESPDDIFPQRPHNIGTVTRQDAGIEEKLLDLWAKIKNRLYHLEIQDNQVARWFSKNYHLEVGLIDFDLPKPPAKFTIEMMSEFLRSVDRHAVC